MPREPSLENFQYAQLSAVEKGMYDEEASKVEAEMLQMSLAMSEKEVGRCQSPTRPVQDVKVGNREEWHTPDMPPSYGALHNASGRGDYTE